MIKKVKPKPKKVSAGTNIRFNENSFAVISSFCKEKGYKLGAFCEIAALERVKNESTNNL